MSWLPVLEEEFRSAGPELAPVRDRSSPRADCAFSLALDPCASIAPEPDCVLRPDHSSLVTFPPGDRLRAIASEEGVEPLGVLLTAALASGDLCMLFRPAGSTLVLETLDTHESSLVVLVPARRAEPARYASWDPGASHCEFAGLHPGACLVAMYSLAGSEALCAEAQKLRDSDRRELALEYLERSLRLNPDSHLAWCRKAYVLRELGRRDEALAAVAEALRLNPAFALGWRCKGAILRDREQHQAGLECYLRSLQLNPTDYLCWQNKGNALQALGRKDEAEAAWAEAERVKAAYPEEQR